ncbi:MAG TPA: YicC/YloC family endoribonuclease [Terriglobales bacterium]|nr:YicC/YloC family endoribonuclease [Terriglobales bacterium]
MPIRSMTGFAQVKGQALDPRNLDLRNKVQLGFTLSVKSVNHRFLDLHFRLPAESDELEMKLRRALKEKLVRGHVELSLNLERAGSEGFTLNRQLVSGYVQAFRAAAAEFGITADPDLNAILRIPGAMDTATFSSNGALEACVLAKLGDALDRLNHMRQEEGSGIEQELRHRMEQVRKAGKEVEKHRQAVLRTYADKLKSRLRELIDAPVEPERILQEAALLVDRSDIQEELVRLDSHVKHFLGLLDQGGEVGKKLDFLLQEMNREANTLLSKTSGLAGEALKITEMGLLMKTEIEKAREQVQNLE